MAMEIYIKEGGSFGRHRMSVLRNNYQRKANGQRDLEVLSYTLVNGPTRPKDIEAFLGITRHEDGASIRGRLGELRDIGFLAHAAGSYTVTPWGVAFVLGNIGYTRTNFQDNRVLVAGGNTRLVRPDQVNATLQSGAVLTPMTSALVVSCGESCLVSAVTGRSKMTSFESR